MHFRQSSTGIAWLLVLVLLRSLIPTGFMPVWTSGHFELSLCEGQGTAFASSQAHHHQSSKSGTALEHGVHSGEDCAYAQSAHPALALAWILVSAPASAMTVASPESGFCGPHFSPARYCAPRGPPLAV